MAMSKENLITLYTNLFRTRAFDQTFVRRLEEGRLLGFFHPADGGEAPGVGACSFLRPDDYLYPHIRGHGLPHLFPKGADPKYLSGRALREGDRRLPGMSTFHFVAPEFGSWAWPARSVPAFRSRSATAEPLKRTSAARWS